MSFRLNSLLLSAAFALSGVSAMSSSEFVFKHHVLHQVAYQGVLKQSRREQHRLTADWLVVRSGDRASEYFGLIAEHYEKAGDNVNAVDYLRKAGEDAVNSYVNQAALDYLGRALALAPEDDAPMRFELLRARYRVYSNTGRRPEQQAEIAALEVLAERLDDDLRRALAANLRSAYALVTGDYPGAVVAAKRSVELAAKVGKPEAALWARINWARALQFQPSQLARSLRTSTTHTVGFVVPDVSSPFYAAALKGPFDIRNDAEGTYLAARLHF